METIEEKLMEVIKSVGTEQAREWIKQGESKYGASMAHAERSSLVAAYIVNCYHKLIGDDLDNYD